MDTDLYYLDSHCHLNNENLQPPYEEQIKEAAQAGVLRLLTASYDLASSLRAIEIAKQAKKERGATQAMPEIFCSVGLHPHDARLADEDFYNELRKLLKESCVIALGETGLDYWYDNSLRTAQVTAFANQAELCREAKLPIILHLRDGKGPEDGVWEEAFDVIKGVGIDEGIFHCFSGTKEQAKAALDMGFYISFSGVITYPKNHELRDVAKYVPTDRLLTETDAPYLSPQKYRGTPNRPALVVEVYKELAAVKAMPIKDLSVAVWENFNSLFAYKLQNE